MERELFAIGLREGAFYSWSRVLGLRNAMMKAESPELDGVDTALRELNSLLWDHDGDYLTGWSLRVALDQTLTGRGGGVSPKADDFAYRVLRIALSQQDAVPHRDDVFLTEYAWHRLTAEEKRLTALGIRYGLLIPGYYLEHVSPGARRPDNDGSRYLVLRALDDYVLVRGRPPSVDALVEVLDRYFTGYRGADSVVTMGSAGVIADP
jgi:hypothetical protein